jgi:uncharacterized protein YbgA (DUF1722 family)/uncharacterized protein YbbK (DUF523 family)
MELKIGVSACLLGENVRYDGGHKRDPFTVDLLGPFVRYVPVCPEVEVGMGTPREAIHLVRQDGEVHLVGTATGTDHTGAMRAFAERRVAQLAAMDLSGYILKKSSPSCGMERVKVLDRNGVPSKTGRGLFAATLLDTCPTLPIEEEGRLTDPVLRENFIERVFAYRRLKDFFASRWKLGALVEFHTREKLLLLAHEPRAYTKLGRLVASAKERERAELAREYQEIYMAALAKHATRKKHVNVLQHMAGYLKKQLATDEKRELEGVVADYGLGLVPLIVPITLLRHHVRRHGIAYLQGQRYLEPSPKELMLRNHV